MLALSSPVISGDVDAGARYPALPDRTTNLMARIRQHSISMSSLLGLLAFAALFIPSQALYFYIDGTAPKCFFEDLPKDTLVVGEQPELQCVWLAIL